MRPLGVYLIGIYLKCSSVMRVLGGYDGGCGGGRVGDGGSDGFNSDLIVESCRGKYNYHM